jgi:ketol-acid reductoisomerase
MKVFYESDADLSVLTGKTIGMVGYGNQGRAQALNLRDSGVKVIVGNRDDEYATSARADGFTPVSISEAVQSGDIVMSLIPDEVQPSVYESMIAPHLREGQTLSFASGYNVHFNLIQPPRNLDVIMVAPRTIGREVRHAFERGGGVNADVDVRQDFTGSAWTTTLALAKGIGCTRAGAFHTSFGVEAELDLFSEQALWPALLECLLTAYDVLLEKGYPPEAVALELYASGEAADIFRAMAEKGLFEQMKFHSPTAQYGALSRRHGATGDHELLTARMRQALEYIRNGQFAQEWTREQQAGYPKFDRLRNAVWNHPINRADQDVRRLLEPGKSACVQASS